MKVLAWDDKPSDYFESLKKHIETYGIYMTIESKVESFLAQFHKGGWDFVITDLVLADSPAQGENDPTAGSQIAKWVAKTHPVYVVTGIYNSIKLGQLDFPESVVVKSKDTPPSFMAAEIYRDLVQRGLFVDTESVFLIYGRDRNAGDATAEVEAFLSRRCRLKVVKATGKTLKEEIVHDLLEKMKTSAAFVAVCTPDDIVRRRRQEIICQPRQNVLLEIGMAMGFTNGLKRLTFLQKWGDKPGNQALLPSDFGGVVTLRFKNSVEETFDDLQQRLIDLRLRLVQN